MKRPVEMRARRRREQNPERRVRRQTLNIPRNVFATGKALILYCRISAAVLLPHLRHAINRVCSNVYKLPLNESNQISLLTHGRRAHRRRGSRYYFLVLKWTKTQNGRTFND